MKLIDEGIIVVTDIPGEPRIWWKWWERKSNESTEKRFGSDYNDCQYVLETSVGCCGAMSMDEDADFEEHAEFFIMNHVRDSMPEQQQSLN